MAAVMVKPGDLMRRKAAACMAPYHS